MDPAGIVDRGVLVAPAGLEQEDAAAPPSTSRRATTAPADPAPTTTTSLDVSDATAIVTPALCPDELLNGVPDRAAGRKERVLQYR